jgi:hypothetical protein
MKHPKMVGNKKHEQDVFASSMIIVNISWVTWIFLLLGCKHIAHKESKHK